MEKVIAIYNNSSDDLWIKQDKDGRLGIIVESYTPSFNLDQKDVDTSDVKEMLIEYKNVLNRFIEDMNKLPKD